MLSDHRSHTLCEIFLAFFRLGLTAFGGPAMVAYIGDMAVKRGWLPRQSFKEGVVIAQTIPGATAMQTAAYVGLRVRGVSGAAAAYLGFGLPAFAWMVALSAAYNATHSLPITISVFRGLRIIVVAIIIRAAFTFGKSTVKGWQDVVIALVAAVFLFYHVNPILVVLAGGLVGMLVYRKGHVDDSPQTIADSRLNTRPAVLITAVGMVLLAVLLFASRRLFDLAALMLRVDLFAFGGGFASVPLMLHLVTESLHWMATRTFMDGIAMGQITPGPIVITATFVGYQVEGLIGAAVATAYIFFPSFVILILTVPRFDRLKHSPLFQKAMKGILASFVGLLLSVAVGFGVAVAWSPVAVLFGIAALTALMLNVNVPWIVLPGAILSILVFR